MWGGGFWGFAILGGELLAKTWNCFKDYVSSDLLSFPLLGVLCDSADCRPNGKCLAPYCWPRSPDGMWPHGWSWCFPDTGPRQAPWIQFAEEVHVELNVHVGGVAQPKPGPLRLHVQWVQTPRGDSLPLYCLWGELEREVRCVWFVWFVPGQNRWRLGLLLLLLLLFLLL